MLKNEVSYNKNYEGVVLDSLDPISKKILICMPPNQADMKNKVSLEGMIYPLGVTYLYSVLEKAGHKVSVYHAWNEDDNEYLKKLESKIRQFKPDILGISAMTFQRVSTYDTIDFVTSKFPKLKIIVGGVHVSICYEQILKEYPSIIAVIGEGEMTIQELVSSRKNLKDINGIAYCENGQILVTPPRALIQDLDSLPFPKHDLFFNSKRTTAYMLSSRGCPHNCTFCCLNSITRRKYRTRSVENIIAEIDYLVEKFPQLKAIDFADDALLLDIDRAKKLLRAIIKKNYCLSFMGSTRFKPMDDELASLLQKAKFTEVRFGLESGSETILKNIKKNITHEQILSTWKIMSKTNIRLIPFMITGLPGENQKTVDETISLLRKMKKIKHFWLFDYNTLIVYPGTEVYQNMVNSGIINDNYWLSRRDVPKYVAENDMATLLNFNEQILYRSMFYWEIFPFMLIPFYTAYKHSHDYFKIFREGLYKPMLRKLFGGYRK